jgi:transposase InsO family protein
MGALRAPKQVSLPRQAESVWATLKAEFYDRYLWPTKAAAKVAIGDWIERVYNRCRRHSAIGHRYDEPGRLRRPTHSGGTAA